MRYASCPTAAAHFGLFGVQNLIRQLVELVEPATMSSTLQPLLDSQQGARRQGSDLLAVRVHHIVDDGPHNEPSPRNSEDLEKYHQHYSDRAPWLRAAVLGANDGLVSVASIMLGVSGGSQDKHTLILSGVSALVAGGPHVLSIVFCWSVSDRDGVTDVRAASHISCTLTLLLCSLLGEFPVRMFTAA